MSATSLEGTWLHFAGGYWVSKPMCLPLIVQTAGRRQQVMVGIGTSCPGQSPPPTAGQRLSFNAKAQTWVRPGAAEFGR